MLQEAVFGCGQADTDQVLIPREVPVIGVVDVSKINGIACQTCRIPRMATRANGLLRLLSQCPFPAISSSSQQGCIYRRFPRQTRGVGQAET
jgi:hypothetical protein